LEAGCSGGLKANYAVIGMAILVAVQRSMVLLYFSSAVS
jgi:hypothetical protein